MQDTQSCDLSRGDVQCPYRKYRAEGYLNCGLVTGHSGEHKDCYDAFNGREPRKGGKWILTADREGIECG